MPIPEDGTWCWEIRCWNNDCVMKPKSPHVAIRNTTKTDFLRFFLKLGDLADSWNRGNPFKAFEMKLIDCAKIEGKFTLNGNPFIDDFPKRIEAVD